MTRSGPSRERLCEHIYWTLEPGNPLGLLEEALRLAETLEPVEKRIRVEGVKTGRVSALDLPGQTEQALALGIITAAEAMALREYDRKVMDLIHVDDFAQHELGTHARGEKEAPSARQPGSPRESDARATIRAV